MGRPRTRARPALRLARGFERSRLEEQLMAAAYELAVPVVRRALPAEAPAVRHDSMDKGERHKVQSEGGLTA